MSAGRWEWNHEADTVEFISSSPPEKPAVGRRRPTHVHFQEILQKSERLAEIYRVNTRGRQSSVKSLAPGLLTAYRATVMENRGEFVTIHDVKQAAVNLLLENTSLSIPHAFLQLLKSEQLDEVLMALLRYLRCFFQLKSLEDEAKTAAVLDTVAERQTKTRSRGRRDLALTKLAVCYFSLILDRATRHERLKGRTSWDQSEWLLEGVLFSFFCLVSWVAFGRKDLKQIQEEIGRVLYSDNFNAAARTEEDVHRRRTSIASTASIGPENETRVPHASAESPRPSAGGPRTSAGGPRTSAGVPRTSAGGPRTSAGVPQASAEGPRTSAEGPCTSAEGPRTSAEGPRTSAGVPRASGEGPRTSAEGPRTSSEGPRTSAIGPRGSARGPRTSAGGPRTSAGGPRTSAGGPRTSAEGPRTSAEGPRTSAGVPRASGEGPRTSAEGPRTSAEGPRTSSEGPRTSAIGPRGSARGPRTSAGGPRTSAGGPRTSAGGPRTSAGGPRTSAGGPRTSAGSPRLMHSRWRPSLHTVANARSPLMLSLLPSPREQSPHLFAGPKAAPGPLLPTPRGDSEDLEEELSRMSVGILGQRLWRFDPETLIHKDQVKGAAPQ